MKINQLRYSTRISSTWKQNTQDTMWFIKLLMKKQNTMQHSPPHFEFLTSKPTTKLLVLLKIPESSPKKKQKTDE